MSKQDEIVYTYAYEGYVYVCICVLCVYIRMYVYSKAIILKKWTKWNAVKNKGQQKIKTLTWA